MSINPTSFGNTPNYSLNRAETLAHNPAVNHNYVTPAELQDVLDYFNRNPDDTSYSPEMSNRHYELSQIEVEGGKEKGTLPLGIVTEIVDPSGKADSKIITTRVYESSDGKLRLSPEANTSTIKPKDVL